MGEDGASVVYENKPQGSDVDGAVFSFTGLIAIPKKGAINFKETSGDACSIWII